jgi:uncharacterized protein (TIGR02266 family)
LSEKAAERRQSVRVPTHLDCSFESFGSFEGALITNLSSGGVFIATKSPLPIGSELRMRIRIERTNAEIELQGIVVSHNIGPSSEVGKAGMGVRFSQAAPETTKAIGELYQHAIQGVCEPEAAAGRQASDAKRARR